MATYKPLQSVVLTSDSFSVTFSGIDQNYTDLILVCSTGYTATAIGQGVQLRFNGDTAGNYSATVLEGDGSASTSYGSTNGTAGIFNAPSNGNQNSLSPVILSINNYSNTTTYKTWIARNSGPSYVNAYAGVWRATPQAITSITFIPSGTAGNIKSGSTFDLYGIKSGAPQALGGDVVTTDGTYWYHAFKSTGSFTPLKTLSADVLVVAGGGGGGSGLAGGGGGGGFRTATSQSLTSQNYTVTVGAGGAAGPTLQSQGVVGSNSSISGSGFTTFSATGGGGGGGIDQNGVAGGSGGGGGGSQSVDRPGGSGNTGSYTPVEGYAGGKGVTGGSPYHMGGGGGGAGVVGTDATTRSGGAGGNGSANSYSGSSVTYAGGGGGAGRKANSAAGGAGGTGGGGAGAGSTLTTAGAGTANLGGGGGGGDWQEGSSVYTGGAGGSGIVIVRYPV